MLPNNQIDKSVTFNNLTKKKETENMSKSEETFYEIAESLKDITEYKTETQKLKIKNKPSDQTQSELKNYFTKDTADIKGLQPIDTNISTKNTYLISALKKRNETNAEQSHYNSNSINLISRNGDIPGYNYDKSSQPNINLNFNININCHNKNNISNGNKKGITKIVVPENIDESEYESVLHSFLEKNNMGDMSRVNSKFEKVINFQSHYNDNNVERDSSLFSMSEINLNLPNINFELDSELDLNFLNKNLKVFNVKKYSKKQKHKHFKNIVELQNFQADFQQIWVIKLSPSGEYIATGGKTGILKIFEILGINSDKYKESYSSEDILSYLNFLGESPVRSYNNHSDDIIDICWSPRENKILLTASLDFSVILWNIDSENPVQKFLHSSTVTSVSFCPIKEANSDEYFITGCLDKYIRVWNCKTGKVVSYKNIEEYITAVTYFPTGDMIAVGTHNGKCSIFDCKPDLRYNFSFLCRNRIGKYSRGEKITNIEFINKTLVLITTNDCRIRLVNISDGKMIQKYKGLLNEEFMIRAFSDDNNENIISASEDGNVYVWNIMNKESNNKKNYSYECIKPFMKEIPTCSIFGSDLSNTIYLKKLFNLTTKIMVQSIIINATVSGRLQVLLNCEEI